MENNIAERGVRPLVISRKVSFGSQRRSGRTHGSASLQAKADAPKKLELALDC